MIALDASVAVERIVPKRETPPAALSAPDAFLECAGTWEFEPGELEEILQDIEQF